MAKVQIEESLFYKILSYHCYPEAYDENELEMLDALISKELEKKLDSIIARNNYTKSLTAETPEEREEARRKYLDMRGVKPEFRY